MTPISLIKETVFSVEGFEIQISGKAETAIEAILNMKRKSKGTMTVGDWLMKSFPNGVVRKNRKITVLNSGNKKAKPTDSLAHVRATYSPRIRLLAKKVQTAGTTAKIALHDAQKAKSEKRALTKRTQQLEKDNVSLARKAHRDKENAARTAAIAALRDELNNPSNGFHIRVITPCQNALNESGFDTRHYINFLLRAWSRAEGEKDLLDSKLRDLKDEVARLNG